MAAYRNGCLDSGANISQAVASKLMARLILRRSGRAAERQSLARFQTALVQFPLTSETALPLA